MASRNEVLRLGPPLRRQSRRYESPAARYEFSGMIFRGDSMTSERCDREIACQQVMREDASVLSIQWSIFPGRLAAALAVEHLLKRYLACIRSFTATIVRPRVMPTGIELRHFGSGSSLISFHPPVIEGNSLALRVRGGRRHGAGGVAGIDF